MTHELPPLQRGVITIAVMAATLMQVLDTTIVNVALPHMEGALGASPDEITWVLTSYLVASAIFMPLTGYLADRLGKKNYLLWSMFGFVIASICCGAAANLFQMVSFRLLQGIFGAALVPLSQAILIDIYPVAERPKAMAIWGAGIMIGPVLGPTLGGYLTDIASWRWNFYINIPIGLFAGMLAWHFMPASEKAPRKMDWPGLVLISLGIGAFQFLLDRGNGDDWFNSISIRIAALVAISGIFGFILWNYDKKTGSIFDVRIFKDRNFTICSLLLALLGLGLYGGMIILPQLLQGLFNYPVLTTGLVMAPRGVTAMLGMIAVAKLSNRIDPRYLISWGVLLSILGNGLCVSYNLSISPAWIIGPLLIQGFGLGLIMGTLSNFAFTTLPVSMRTDAAGLFSLLRTIGSSLGISIVATLLSRQSQTAWNQVGGFIQPYNPALYHYLAHLNLKISSPLTAIVLSKVLAQQAAMLAYKNVYTFLACGFAVMLPLLLLVKKNSTLPPDKSLPLE